MPTINIDNVDQYEKAIEVLTQLGGTYQGVGPADKPRLLVSQRQYDALIKAKVIRSGAQKVNGSGQKAKSTE